MAFSKYTGIFTSGELAFLQRIFDRLCDEHHLALQEQGQRDQLAREIIQTFESGVTDEVEFRQLISKRRKAGA
ncbi:hypothetical protein [Mesorhizobium abyssinicae]|uniref:hypothetical protein n=1 Tax=Mesorhizobium abyssinicae TaxID=1209958 RepID=UPI00339266DA